MKVRNGNVYLDMGKRIELNCESFREYFISLPFSLQILLWNIPSYTNKYVPSFSNTERWIQIHQENIHLEEKKNPLHVISVSSHAFRLRKKYHIENYKQSASWPHQARSNHMSIILIRCWINADQLFRNLGRNAITDSQSQNHLNTQTFPNNFSKHHVVI